MTSADVLTALRDATATLHARLDAGIDLDRHLASSAAYARFLSAMLGIVAPLEAMLDRFDWQATGLAPDTARWRTPLLRNDLRFLGLPSAGLDALPLAPSPPPPATRDAAFGALYVLEGSALGGQVILRRAEAALGLGPERGASFHASLGRPVGEGWRRFRQALALHCADAGGACDAARDSFHRLESWLSATEARHEPGRAALAGAPA